MKTSRAIVANENTCFKIRNRSPIKREINRSDARSSLAEYMLYWVDMSARDAPFFMLRAVIMAISAPSSVYMRGFESGE